MKHSYKSVLVTVMLALAGAFLSGCNTMRGVGQDTEEAGEAIQDATR